MYCCGGSVMKSEFGVESLPAETEIKAEFGSSEEQKQHCETHKASKIQH